MMEEEIGKSTEQTLPVLIEISSGIGLRSNECFGRLREINLGLCVYI
jgi:hypothetical protein